jgi:hypothetical protein
MVKMNPLELYFKENEIPSTLGLAHILLTIYFIKKEGTLGRYELQKKLGLGDSTTRTLLKFLKKMNTIKSKQKRGHLLTESGIKILNVVQKKIINFHQVHFSEFAFGKNQVLVHLRKTERKIVNGIQERDEAIIAGARGAVTLEVENDRLVMPGIDEEFTQEYTTIKDEIRNLVDLQPSDVLVICSADSLPKAYVGCSTIALNIGWKGRKQN